jgi:hypothetical protein
MQWLYGGVETSRLKESAMFATAVAGAVDEFLPTVERVVPGDVLTALGAELFPNGVVVAGRARVASGEVVLLLAGGRAVTVPAGTPVDLLPPF